MCMKKKENIKRIAIVTGASSGIGLATAKMLKSHGVVVYGMAYNDFEAEFNYIKCDVTNVEQIENSIKYIFEKEGRIDYLVNCAGMGISGSVENSPNEKIHKIYDINFFGTVNMCKAVLPYMRKNSFGHIVNISSVAGELPIPFQTFYSATKASIESFTAGLAMEVKPFGIKAVCVLPGDTKTGFTNAREKNELDDESYGKRVKNSVGQMEHDEQHGMTPESVAKVICKALFKKNPKPINVVGGKYKFFIFLSKIVPKRFAYWILYKMYASK